MLDKPTVLTTPGRSEETSLDVLISDIYGGHFGSDKRGQMHRLFQASQLAFAPKKKLRTMCRAFFSVGVAGFEPATPCSQSKEGYLCNPPLILSVPLPVMLPS